MWRIRVFFGVLFTVIGVYNSMFHTKLNLIAAIIMFLFAAKSLNLAVKEYYEEKEEQNKEEDND